MAVDTMYKPKHFDWQNLSAMIELVREYPLATLIVSQAGQVDINHIPFVLDTENNDAFILRGHVPKTNPLVSSLESNAPCVAVFHGPNDYISPSWYASKKQNEKVVPTWNYSVVHLHGNIHLISDGSWINQQITDLTDMMESKRPVSWAVSDAPSTYINRLTEALVGIEIRVTKIDGKKKASQNQPENNQRSVL